MNINEINRITEEAERDIRIAKEFEKCRMRKKARYYAERGYNYEATEKLYKVLENMIEAEWWEKLPEKEVLECLDANAYWGIDNSRGEIALSYACRDNQLELVRTLIKVGADVNYHNELCETPLMDACSLGRIEIVKELIKNKAGVNCQNGNGWTPLMWSCGFGDIKIVKELIKAKADLNIQDKEGKTAAMWAVACGPDVVGGCKTEILKELINANANLSIKDKKGKNVQDYAKIKAISLKKGERIFLEILQNAQRLENEM